MNNEKKEETIAARQRKDKLSVIEQLKKIPIVQIACERVGISRATYYRWRDEDKEFRKDADSAISEGVAVITDMSEAQHITLIRDKHWPAINAWLKIHHPAYNKKEIPKENPPVEVVLPILGDSRHKGDWTFLNSLTNIVYIGEPCVPLGYYWPKDEQETLPKDRQEKIWAYQYQRQQKEGSRGLALP